MNPLDYFMMAVMTVVSITFFSAIVLEYKEKWIESFYLLMFSFALLLVSLLILLWLNASGMGCN